MAIDRPDPYPDPQYVFGPIIGPHDIDEILYDILHLWQVSYLREVARRAGEDPDQLVPFRSWRVSQELEHMPEDQTPGLIIMNGGLDDEPLKRGTLRPGKSFYAIYKYRFGCLASAKGTKVKAAPRANKLAKMYATAVRSILIQKRDDRDILGMMDWVDDLPGPLSSEDDRTIAMWVVEFNVEVPNTAAWATGPQVPDPLPEGETDPPLLGTVQTADATIDKTPLDEPFPTPQPPEPSWGTLLGNWTWRPSTNPANLQPGEIYKDNADPALVTALYISDHTLDGIDRQAELLMLGNPGTIRISYPGSEELPREFVANYTLAGQAVAWNASSSGHIFVAVSVTFIDTTGDPTHYGEDHVLRVAFEEAR